MSSRCVALVTGGAQGLGRAFSERLLKEGAKVAVADVNVAVGMAFEKEMKHVYGENRLKFIHCDVSNSNELFNTFDNVKSTFGSLDIVCNNAGIGSLNPKDARKIIDVNLTAVIEGTYKAIELMSRKNGGNGGVVVNVASAAGLEVMRGESMYSASKYGVVAFSRSFKHLPVMTDDGVRVNCICPFFVDTELYRKTAKEVSKDKMEFYKSLGMAEKDDVVKAFMRCVDENEMNGNTVAIYPHNQVFDVYFPKIKPAKAKL